MCVGPEAAAFITLVSAGVSTAAAIDQGNQQSAILRNNARVEEWKAEDANKRGVEAAEQQLARTRQIRSQQLAIMGAAGVDPTKGTAADVINQTTTMGTLDAMTIRANAAREAWGFQTSSNNMSAQAGFARNKGVATGFDTLLTGGTRAYGIYKGVG